MEPRLIRADLLIQDIANDEAEFSGKGCSQIVKHIFEAPAIDAAPVVHGRWEILEEANCVDTYGNPSKYAKCTNCGFRWSDLYSVKKYFNSCPFCGAKMDMK